VTPHHPLLRDIQGAIVGDEHSCFARLADRIDAIEFLRRAQEASAVA